MKALSRLFFTSLLFFFDFAVGETTAKYMFYEDIIILDYTIPKKVKLQYCGEDAKCEPIGKAEGYKREKCTDILKNFIQREPKKYSSVVTQIVYDCAKNYPALKKGKNSKLTGDHSVYFSLLMLGKDISILGSSVKLHTDYAVKHLSEKRRAKNSLNIIIKSIGLRQS